MMNTALMKNKTKIEKQSANKAEMSSSELMSVSEMGSILGLKKTDRYWLIHKEFFETRMYLGKMWVVRESFEKWYAGQVKYHKVNGEEPGADLKKNSYSARDIARMLAINEATAYEIIKREHLETIEVDYWRRVPKEVFDRWYSHIIDEDQRRNAALFEEAFYGKKNLDPQMRPADKSGAEEVPDDVDAELIAKVLANPEMKALLVSLAKTVK